MATKGGGGFVLLVVVCAALANRPDGTPGNKDLFRDVSKKLMMNCRNKGVPVPKEEQLKAIYKNSDVPMADVTSDQYDKFLSVFLRVLGSVTGDKDADRGSSRPPMADVSEKLKFKMWTFRNLPVLAKMIRSSSDSSICYLRSFLAPAAWVVLTAQDEVTMDEDAYGDVKWAAIPVFELREVDLPSEMDAKKMKKMMDMLQEAYDLMSEEQKNQVSKWEKEQITENYFNCTLKPPSAPRSKPMGQCTPSVQWLNWDAMSMMGPFMSHLNPDDVDFSPKEKLCHFFSSSRFNSTMNRANMKHSMIRKFLTKFQECFKGNDSMKHMDKLGPLACYYYDVRDLTPEKSRKALAQLDKCDNPQSNKAKRQIINYMMSNSTIADSLPDFLNKSITLLTSKQLSKINSTKLTDIVRKLGRTVKWTRRQLRILVKKQLGGKKCKDVSPKDLEALKPIAEGLPRCILKKMKAQDILSDTTGLRNATKRMKKGKLKAMLEKMENMTVSDMMEKLPGALLRCVPLDKLKKVNEEALDKADNEGWNKAQAAYLVKKMPVRKFRKLRSLIQGVTCKIIDEVADRDVEDMAQGITENQKWVSKVQARCAALKVFATREKEKPDYFKTINEDELDRINPVLLVHLPPQKVRDLPDPVCPVFLDKMENANLSKVPLRSPCRLALTERALRCLTKEKELSELTEEDVSKLGPLLCELPPSQLELMAPDVVKSSLQAMASCEFIPQRNKKELMKLVPKIFGNPPDWSAETVESLLPVMDDDAIAALPNRADVKEVILFMKSRLSNVPKALRKKAFQLTTSNTTNAARRKRAANGAQEPTEAVIEDLGSDNVFWEPEQLGRMSSDTFLSTVETLGEIPDFSAEQLVELRKKAEETIGPVSQMTEDDVMQLGCITQGLSNSDLKNLPLSLDSAEELAECDWPDSQVESVWNGVAKFNGLTAPQLGTTDMVALNRFICGLSSDEIKQLNVDAFKEAMGSMNEIQCSSTALEKLKPLVVAARGDPSTWTESDISEVGTLIVGLTKKDWQSVDPAVLPFVPEFSISRIPAENFAALSVAQLSSLGPDNAAMVTSEQRAALTDEQRDALERAETGSDGEESPTTILEGGAPSLSVEGVSAFVKPVLVFLMGVLLL